MHIFLTVPSLAQISGGPAIVVQHLSEYLAKTGAEVTVLTGAAETGSAQMLPRDERVKVVAITRQANGSRGTSSAVQFRRALEPGLVSADKHIIHDFGIWLPANHTIVSVSRELGIPLVISPCGMLAPWALQHKRWKKRLAWWLYQKRDLSRAALLVATAPAEQRDIQKLFPRKAVALIPHGVIVPELRNHKPEVSGPRSLVRAPGRTAVFLGRIHRVKGLKNLVEAWSRVRPAGWRCILAGPDEAGHQAELLAALRAHNLQNDFAFPGMMDDAAKWNLMRQADLFVLPSFTENFGLAAAEALACGVPVITTKGAPWQDLIEHRCGWWVGIGVEPLAEALQQATSLTDEQRVAMGVRGRELVQAKYSWSEIVQSLHLVYRWVLSPETKPLCVTKGANVR